MLLRNRWFKSESLAAAENVVCCDSILYDFTGDDIHCSQGQERIHASGLASRRVTKKNGSSKRAASAVSMVR